MKDLKESNPIEVADYVAAMKLTNEPAFKWWVPYVLRNLDRIVASVIQHVKKKRHKIWGENLWIY